MSKELTPKECADIVIDLSANLSKKLKNDEKQFLAFLLLYKTDKQWSYPTTPQHEEIAEKLEKLELTEKVISSTHTAKGFGYYWVCGKTLIGFLDVYYKNIIPELEN